MLTSEIIRRVKEIQIRTGRQVSDVLAGEYMSVFKGGGVEFDEVRPYVPGDDVRTIDWNVTARSGQPFVKRFQEERQLSLMIMADVSASQDFGSQSRSKREITAELCALLAFSAIRNDDKVGLILFHGEIEQYIPPRKGQTHALRVVREVLAHGQDDASAREKTQPSSTGQWSGLIGWWANWRRKGGVDQNQSVPSISRHRQTNISHAMDFMMTVGKRRNVCFLVSDFLDHNFERAVAAANRKHDVIAVLVSDVREGILPDVGLITLKDAETGGVRVVDTGSGEFRATVEEGEQRRIAELKQRLGALKVDCIHVDTSGSIVEPLIRFFRMRERRIRR